jgi:2-polyprenyl-3-methyl-5-hydroxy-6-metoxy-1,4-benzoquinol methylase
VREIDDDKLGLLLKQTGGMVAASFNCAITVLGDRLGLYQALGELGPSTSSELALHVKLHERWVREWLHQQTCIGQLEYLADGARFAISPEAYAVLADEDHPAYLMGGFESALAVFPAVGKLEESFRTGIGMSYDDHGPNCACGIERMGAFTKKHRLVGEMIPQLPGMHDRLVAGAMVADVGCGGGLATIALAQAYPATTFVGYDTSDMALQRAKANLAEAGVANVRFCNPFAEPLPKEPTFDLITTFDVIHDTPYPQDLIVQIYAALKADGQWLCEDIKGFESFEENLEHHPAAALLYGFSVTVCMNSGLSTADGAGLGTLGFTHQVAETMTQQAGFREFQLLDIENPMNNYYLMGK